MRVIRKEISVEDFTSRLPSVLPAYFNNKLYFFDDKSLMDREYLYPSNYGMVPVNIILNHKPNGELRHTDYEIVCGGEFTISFHTLSKWYHEFEDYYALLNDYSHCSLVYKNAVDYYQHESGFKYRDQMIYGVDKQTYIDLDEKIRSMGGKPVFHAESGETVDEGFYKWICENIVPSFILPIEYRDFWKTKKLYYPDAVHWIGWFAERVNKYEGEGMTLYTGATSASPETWDCRKDGIDCCDCDEYFKRGGKRVYDLLKDWYNSVQDGIRRMNEIISSNESCFIPTMILPTSIQDSIDDIGQFSIFSKEYECGIDYRVASGYGVSENTMSGTVVTYENESKILSGSGMGFCFDKNLMERVYKGEDWGDYTKLFISQNADLFVTSSHTYYTYDTDGLIVTSTANTQSNAKTDLVGKLTNKYEITRGNWVVSENGTLIPIETSEYGIVWNKTTDTETRYFIYRDEHTETPYTMIDGKIVYGELYRLNGKPVFYFSLFKKESGSTTYEASCSGSTDSFDINRYKLFPRRVSDITDTMSYFRYNGVIHEIPDNETSFIIDEIRFNLVSGYAIDESDDYIYCFADGSTPKRRMYQSFYDIENASIEGNYVLIKTITDPVVYRVDEVTGTTVSKIYDLRVMNLLVDDIGNRIEGVYNPQGPNKYYHQPKEGDDIEPMYQVGNVANIGRIEGITSDNPTGNTNYFIGDIITEMVFYYKDIQGNVFDKSVYVTKINDNDGSREISGNGLSVRNLSNYVSLSAITYATLAKKAQEEAQEEENYTGEYWNFIDDIFCDVTYYVGATLRRNKKGANGSTQYALAGRMEEYNEGVEYKETVRFVRKETEYYLKKQPKSFLPITIKKPSSHSVSYPIYTYILTQDMTEMENTTYGTIWNVPLATFKTKINLVNRDLTTTFSRLKDMETYNGIQVYPVFKEEYLMGISSLENVDANIYIERGINAAFERHLKLGEVKSLDDVVTYGNGYFKIMED